MRIQENDFKGECVGLISEMASNQAKNSATEAESVKRYAKRVRWNRVEHYAFLKHVAHAIRKGHKKGSSLDKEGWDLVIALMKRGDKINVDRSMLKNHYDTTRRLWQAWSELREYNGLGWNPFAHTFIASESEWKDFFKRYKCERLKLWGYDDEAEANLYTIFGRKHATGQNKTCDSSGSVPPSETPQELPDQVDECGEDMDANSPSLDNDSKGECVGLISEMDSNQAINSATEAESVKKYTKRVQWNREEHYAFLKHVAHAIRKGHKKGSGLDKEGWDLVIALLKEDNINVDQSMLKNHYDASKRLWRGWTDLREHNGLSWNPIAHTFIVSDSVWENFFKRHKDCKRLKLWGYDEEAEANLYTIFGKKHARGQNGMYDSSDSVPPSKTPQELPDQVDECGEDVDANSPTLDNDIDSENRGNEAPATTELGVFGSTRQVSPASVPSTTAPPRSSRPTTSPSARNTRKRKSPGEVMSAGHEIALSMKKRKAITSEAIHSAAMEDLEEEKYKKCIALLKALPGYNLSDTMYTDAATYFLKKPVRCLWLAMGDDAKFREKWLRGYWLQHRSV